MCVSKNLRCTAFGVTYSSNFSPNHKGLDRALSCFSRQHSPSYSAHKALTTMFMRAMGSQTFVLSLCPNFSLTVHLNGDYSTLTYCVFASGCPSGPVGFAV